MSLKFKFLILCLVLVAAYVLPFQVNAVSPSSISIDAAPINPSAGEDTTITLSSYGSNLNTVSISWFVNGKKTTSGIGVKAFTVKAPAVGSSTTVRAVIALPDGDIEKNITIRPNVMALLWQATDSYVPPFYRGKALPTIDSEIKVVAMPEIKSGGVMINPKSLLYTWKKNYENEPEGSGYGKNSFTFINDYLEDLDTISVTASTIDGQSSSGSSTSIRASAPQVSFYKNDSRMGTIWDQALADGHRIIGDETIVAEPYFISPKELWSPSLVWNWFINGALTNNTLPYKGNWLPVKVEGGVTGVSTIRLDIQNNNQILQTAGKQISVGF